MFMKCHVDFSQVESQDELATVMTCIQEILETEPVVMVIKADPLSLRDENGNVCTHLFER